MPENGHSYEAAGVSIERGDRAVTLMRSAVERTYGPEVIGGPGGFAGLYALSGMTDPVLASTIDGIGTKTVVAREVGRYDTLGADIVNHCANDVLATGARPLVFMDYAASGRLDPEAIAGVVRGAAEACGALGMSLVGGETAEMPGMYGDGDLEVVGSCIGACERSEIVTGEDVRIGDAVIGLSSTGLHTNGFTLARKVIEDWGSSYSDAPESLGRTIGEAYLETHRAYVREISTLRGTVEIHGLAHITGGGLPGNLPRALGGLGARLDASAWQEPAVFALIRKLGNIPEDEMRRVFNLGIGFCVVVGEADAGRTLEVLHNTGCGAGRIGEVTGGEGVAFD